MIQSIHSQLSQISSIPTSDDSCDEFDEHVLVTGNGKRRSTLDERQLKSIVAGKGVEEIITPDPPSSIMEKSVASAEDLPLSPMKDVDSVLSSDDVDSAYKGSCGLESVSGRASSSPAMVLSTADESVAGYSTVPVLELPGSDGVILSPLTIGEDTGVGEEVVRGQGNQKAR